MEATTRPLVSIVVPVYKVEEYLPRCLDSILAQEYRELEIIVVNDGSPDGCGDIMRTYAARDPRLRLVFQPNGGLSAARNAGMALATGEFLAFVDSDDYIAPDYVSRMVRLALRRDADVVVCNFTFELASGVRIPFPLLTAHRNLTGEQAGQRALDMLKIPMFAWNKLYRRTLFSGPGVTFPAIYYEDIATIAQVLSSARRVAITHKPLYYYCLRKTGIVGNFNGRNVRDYLHAVDIVRHFLWDQRLWVDWWGSYTGFLRRVETQLVISIMARQDLPLRRRLRAARMVRREIARLRAAPRGAPHGAPHGSPRGDSLALSADAEVAFRHLAPRAQPPRRAARRLVPGVPGLAGRRRRPTPGR